MDMTRSSTASPSVPIPDQFRRSLVTRCALLFGGGLAVTAAILYAVLAKSAGTSYGETFRTLASTRQELLSLSLGIYLLVSLLILGGIAVISLLYSHRIVGPLYRLGVIARTIRNGDLRQQAHLRKKDMVTPLADELNAFCAVYRDTIASMQEKTGEIKKLAAELASCEDQQRRQEIRRRIAAVVADMHDRLDSFTL